MHPHCGIDSHSGCAPRKSAPRHRSDTHTHTHTHIHTHTRTHALTHARTHAHTRTHTHTNQRRGIDPQAIPTPWTIGPGCRPACDQTPPNERGPASSRCGRVPTPWGWLSEFLIYIYINRFLIPIHTYIYIHTYIHTLTHTCMHACIHTHIHTHITHAPCSTPWGRIVN
jgi:hypothetical protein